MDTTKSHPPSTDRRDANDSRLHRVKQRRLFSTGLSVNTVYFPPAAAPPALRSNEKDKVRPNLGTPLLPLSPRSLTQGGVAWLLPVGLAWKEGAVQIARAL